MRELTEEENKGLNKNFFDAILRGDLDKAEELISYGVDLNEGVCIAAMIGNLDTIKYLVKHGAPIGKDESYLRHPIIEATKEGYLDIVKYLHEHGADINIKDIVRLACIGGHLEIVKYLVENGIDKKHINDALECFAIEDKIDHVKFLVSQGGDIEKGIEWALIVGNQVVYDKLIEYKTSLEEREILLVDFNEMKEKLSGIRSDVTAKKMKI